MARSCRERSPHERRARMSTSGPPAITKTAVLMHAPASCDAAPLAREPVEVAAFQRPHRVGHGHRQRRALARRQLSGSGMNSVSPGTEENRPAFHSAFACSIRSLREATKFHQI